MESKGPFWIQWTTWREREKKKCYQKAHVKWKDESQQRLRHRIITMVINYDDNYDGKIQNSTLTKSQPSSTQSKCKTMKLNQKEFPECSKAWKPWLGTKTHHKILTVLLTPSKCVFEQTESMTHSFQCFWGIVSLTQETSKQTQRVHFPDPGNLWKNNRNKTTKVHHAAMPLLNIAVPCLFKVPCVNSYTL